MKKITRLFLCFLGVLFALAPLVHSNTFKISEDLDRTIQKGLHELYSLRFEEAEKVFDSVSSEADQHPMVAFGKASLHWWRLSVFVLENDSDESQPFLKAVNDCIRISKNKIESGDTTGEAHLVLGGAYGLLGRWQATNRSWLSAYFTGKKAINLLRKALKINPDLNDAYMGLGIFDYYVATLPSAVRVLAFLGSNNDPKVGLEELKKAATSSNYSNIPSKLFLADLYSNQEKKPEEAFQILEALRLELPQSPFVHMLYIITLYNHNRMELLTKEISKFKENAENGTYPKNFIANGNFLDGMVYFKLRDWANAMEKYNAAIEKSDVKNPFYTWSQLYKGYSLDMLGKRQDAVLQYQEVLKEIRRWGSHEAAKLRLSKPFQGKEEDLEKIRL
jgi:tetratricopeptide (TPR) repeat protein